MLKEVNTLLLVMWLGGAPQAGHAGSAQGLWFSLLEFILTQVQQPLWQPPTTRAHQVPNGPHKTSVASFLGQDKYQKASSAGKVKGGFFWGLESLS